MLSWFLSMLKYMENLSSRISVLFNCTPRCCLGKDGPQLWEISADLSVQLSGFWIRCLAKLGRRAEAGVRSCWAGGKWCHAELQCLSGNTGTVPAWEGISVQRAKKKIRFYVFGQGSYFEYIWLNRIFHFTVLIINHTHWINAIFVIPLKCNFFCTVSELHDRCNIFFLCSW